MSKRRFKLQDNDQVTHCPKCSNNTVFTAFSDQVSEDGCEVWVVCKCSYDPTLLNTLHRYESVMGGVDDDNIHMALSCWNDAIADEVSQCQN